jgi:hypothetical protein
VPPSVLSPGIDSSFEKIILTALAQLPENRYQQAAELEQDLRRFIAKTGELTGASDVAHLIDSLAGEQKLLHQEQLAAFKFRTPTPHGVGKRGSSSVPSVSVHTAIEATSSGPPHKMHRFAKRERVIFAVIGGVAASLLTALTIHLISVPSSPSDIQNRDNAYAIDNFKSGRNEAGALSEAPMRAKTTAMLETVAQADTRMVETPKLVKIAVTRRPEQAELLLNGQAVDGDGDTLLLPNDGRNYEIVARANGYVTQVYSVVAEQGETLLVELSRAEPPSADRPMKVSGAKHVESVKKKSAKPSSKVLKGNPY